ncbi:MAG TPA: polyprenyl synthetase family protein [Gemmatales bacterium]|nr:polyprenyl synthetase family protein [Gemmatales bacterium]
MTPELDAHLAPLRAEIEQSLAAALDLEAQCPPRLLEAMRYSLLAPAKRLRPLLALLACAAAGGPATAALPAASALEMVHTYSLVHDDLPGMDNDDLRRGRPTCHRQFDEATAILVGDGLLTLAFQHLVRELQPAEVAAACVLELAQGAGVAGMVGGQLDDLAWERQGGGSLATLESIHRRKTGALFKAALRMGCRIGLAASGRSQDDPLLTHFATFAADVGLAFQIADDLLDIVGNEELAGKKLNKDAARGKLTYPSLLGVEQARAELAAATGRATASLKPLGDQARWLVALVEWMGSRQA